MCAYRKRNTIEYFVLIKRYSFSGIRMLEITIDNCYKCDLEAINDPNNSQLFFVDYQNGSEMYKWYQVLVQDLDENVDENLAWLTQKTEDPKM